jgi:hypothetical protein
MGSMIALFQGKNLKKSVVNDLNTHVPIVRELRTAIKVGDYAKDRQF